MDPEGLDRSSNSPLIRLDGNPPVIDWRTCPPVPLAWIPLRELRLGLVHTPALRSPRASVLVGRILLNPVPAWPVIVG